MRLLQRWHHDTRGDMAETALVMPVVTLLVMAMVTLAMTSWAATSANTIAQRAARAASVVQSGPGARATAAISAAQELAGQFGYGDYTIEVLNPGSGPGDQVVVRVTWTAPNWAASAVPLFPGLFGESISGTAIAAYRVEGW